jgi:hypothetical protein
LSAGVVEEVGVGGAAAEGCGDAEEPGDAGECCEFSIVPTLSAALLFSLAPSPLPSHPSFNLPSKIVTPYQES